MPTLKCSSKKRDAALRRTVVAIPKDGREKEECRNLRQRIQIDVKENKKIAKTGDLSHLKVDGVKPSEQCLSLIVQYRPKREPNNTSFELNSRHDFHTSVNLGTYRKCLYVQEFARQCIVETVSPYIPERTTTVSLRQIRKEGSHRVIEYEIVDEGTFVSSLDSIKSPAQTDDDIITTDAFESRSSHNYACHPSLRTHFEAYGGAMLEFTRSRGLINDPLDSNTPTVREREINATSGGVYAKLDELLQAILKYGWASVFLQRQEWYNRTNPGTTLKVVFDYQRLSYDDDQVLVGLLDALYADIENDPNVPAYIKRLFYEKYFVRGGDRHGLRPTFVGKLIEGALQRESNLSQTHRTHDEVLEMGQYDDTTFFEAGGAVLRAAEAASSLVENIGPNVAVDAAAELSWPCAPVLDENKQPIEDYHYMKLIATEYVGATGMESAYDSPAVPGASTIDARYCSNYPLVQDQAAMMHILKFLYNTANMYNIGCARLCDTNGLACRKTGSSIKTEIEEVQLKLRAQLLGGLLSMYFRGKAMLELHPPLCKVGNIKLTLEENLKGGVVVETLRRITLMAKGLSPSGPMLAVEAAMAERNFVCGFNMDPIYKGMIAKEYLAGKAFDQWRNHGNPVLLYPHYPIAEKNRQQYKKRM